ncbi:mitochondrial phosphate carrier protein [Microsporum canis]
MTAAPAAIPQLKTNKPEGIDLYARFALAGALGCSITHSAFTPVDIVKTRIQLDPTTYNNGMIGFGPTFAGYFMQGAFKFGDYEFFQQKLVDVLGAEKAKQNRTAVYIVFAGCAEFFASIALCPLEATRIRLVSTPGFAGGLIGGFGKILKNEGIGAFYSGFGPILFKQVPYTITKFVAFEKVSEAILSQFDDKSQMSAGASTAVNLGSGLIGGFAAAIVSQPADTMLSKINKTKALPGEGTVSRLIKIAGELGLRGSFAGLPTRLFMVGGLTAGQFAIYGDIKKLLAKCYEVERGDV